MNIFLGVLFVVMGGFVMYFSGSMKKWFGVWKWAEQYLGGTMQGYVIIGFIGMIIGLLAIFGVINLAR